MTRYYRLTSSNEGTTLSSAGWVSVLGHNSVSGNITTRLWNILMPPGLSSIALLVIPSSTEGRLSVASSSRLLEETDPIVQFALAGWRVPSS